MDVAAMQTNLEGVASGMTSTGRAHDFEQLFRDDGPRLWRALYAYSGGRRDVADDAVAEAFARALEHQGSIRSPKPWGYRIAFRVATAAVRRERGRGELRDRGAEGPAARGEVTDAL